MPLHVHLDREAAEERLDGRTAPFAQSGPAPTGRAGQRTRPTPRKALGDSCREITHGTDPERDLPHGSRPFHVVLVLFRIWF